MSPSNAWHNHLLEPRWQVSSATRKFLRFLTLMPLGVWHLLWFENPAIVYPPFKGLQPSDFATKIKRKRYSEWTVLVKHLRDAIKSTTVLDLKPPQSQHEADVLFDTAIANVPMKMTPDGKKPSRADRAATTLRRIREVLHDANPEARTVPFRLRKRRATNQLHD
ncbi:hypothetical protein ON010_g13469 [Phytophthora cinnamomi]|nr:hypothetical protein ON010_g13469 [Phytophthora cinnamomi]